MNNIKSFCDSVQNLIEDKIKKPSLVVDIKDDLDKIIIYTTQLVNNDITILDVARRANNVMDYVTYLSHNFAEYFKGVDIKDPEKHYKYILKMLLKFKPDMKENKNTKAKTSKSKSKDPAPDPEKIIEKIVEDEKYLRLYADFENHKKRVSKDKQDIVTQTKYKVLSSLLDIIDEFELAKSSNNDSGVDLILGKMNTYLKEQNIQEVDTTIPFNSDIHECLTVIDMGKKMSGKIIETVKRGYIIDNRIVRYPKVVVGK